MIRKALITSGTALAIIAASAAPASARPVPDKPIECGPGYIHSGVHCYEIRSRDADTGKLADYGMAIFGIIGLAAIFG